MSVEMVLPKLDAYKTEKGNFFVIFHEYYGAYFNADLSKFIGENPVRVNVYKEEHWIKKTWGENSKLIKLSEADSEKLIKIVANDPKNGLKNIREKVDETYSWINLE